MRQYESAFLGLILAGVVMMVIGLALMMSSAGSTGSQTSLAQRLADRTPAFGGGINDVRSIGRSAPSGG